MSVHETLVAMNQVEGFNPLDYARTITSPIVGQPPGLYLDVKYRVAWFRLKYPQGKIRKEIKKLDENMAVVECFIYKDANDQPESYLANGFGQRHLDTSTTYGLRYLEYAETAAVGRALSAAGFNIFVGGSDEDEEESPVDSSIQSGGTNTSVEDVGVIGIPYAKTGAVASSGRPAASGAMPPSTTHHVNCPSAQPQYTPITPVEEILKVMSVDDAKSVVIPFNGSNKGKTLAQVAQEDPKTLDWIMTNYSGPNNVLRAGARKLLSAGMQLAS